MHSPITFLFTFLIVLATITARAGEDTNTYKDGEPVRVYANKIGPLHNALETYDFFRTPGCPPASNEQKAPTLGQALVGDELYELNVSIHYNQDVKRAVICSFTPTEGDITRWKEMITGNYAYQLLVDELPLWAMFGKMTSNGPMIYLHRIFHIGVNNQQLVNVTLETGRLESLRAGKAYEFTYSVQFSPSLILFENRFAKYMDEDLFEPRIRWFAIANSLLLAVFLVIVVTMILSRVIRADYQRIEHELRMRDEGNDDLVDSTGWKQLYADVHRVPSFPTLLCALVGTGVQLAVVFVLGVLTAALYSFRRKPTQGAVTVVAVSYAFTGIVAGFVSSAQFLRYAMLSPVLSKKWMRCMEFTMFVFPLFLLSCGTVTNVLAHLYESAQVVHMGGITFLIALLFLGFGPSVVAGTLLGRYAYRRLALAPRSHRDLPHVNQIPRLIPPAPNVFLSTTVFILLCGALPFGSIVFELCLVLSSIWLNKLYYLYTFLLLTFIIFLVVTCCVSIAATYVLLNMENHRWPWVTFGFGASSGLYVFLYSLYFYTFRTAMSGLFITVFYFTYSATLSAAVALTGGSFAFLTASLFIRKIYAFVKLD
ncbi:putative endomembrane protein [Trypanosoma theileri]|uniref:Transmembrane 9 superfamily member n=1 Tax=Trypanosoma theileri TaxID=67003 RepID=A0A1X0NJN3_9TRYP|nr:putative endomembrane protein [Trypanosoma theileri]ORC84886.1 putative endomembrane protein [Trypanosoma theileri]